MQLCRIIYYSIVPWLLNMFEFIIPLFLDCSTCLNLLFHCSSTAQHVWIYYSIVPRLLNMFEFIIPLFLDCSTCLNLLFHCFSTAQHVWIYYSTVPWLLNMFEFIIPLFLDCSTCLNLLFHCSLTAQHVSSDIIAHHYELLNYNYIFWIYSRLSLPAAVMAEWGFSHVSGRQRQTWVKPEAVITV
jgi:hypothetical protein